MQVTTQAIVLSALKYGDTSLIVRMYTLSNGLKSYLLKGVLASKKGKLKSAYFQPLTQLELVAYHRNKGSLERIREAKIMYPYQTLHRDMTKNAMIFFLAEILGNSIHEEEGNPGMFHFMKNALQWLDTHDKIANFHLYFLLTLTKYLGFYPGTLTQKGSYFDLLEGEFVATLTGNPMIADRNLSFFKRFLGINFDEVHTIAMNQTDRQELLKSLILYYELHLQGFRRPRSLAVLNEVFR
ncbi:MAG: DNA repair protein RecO [Bacteroidota bacterium]